MDLLTPVADQCGCGLGVNYYEMTKNQEQFYMVKQGETWMVTRPDLPDLQPAEVLSIRSHLL